MLVIVINNTKINKLEMITITFIHNLYQIENNIKYH